MQRVRGAIGSVFFHNNELCYEVAKDTVKWTFRGGGIGGSFGSRDPHNKIKDLHFHFCISASTCSFSRRKSMAEPLTRYIK